MRLNDLPYLLREFIRDTGWPMPRPHVAQNMYTALLFFTSHLSGWINRPLEETDHGYRVHGPSPFAFKMRGKATKLTGAMQAIDFNWPVVSITLEGGTRLHRYAKPSEPRGKPATGLWYADWNTPANILALPPDQTSPHGYEVVGKPPALRSTAGDLLVDWGMNPDPSRVLVAGIDYHYCHGGGIQYVIPNAAQVLKPL